MRDLVPEVGGGQPCNRQFSELTSTWNTLLTKEYIIKCANLKFTAVLIKLNSKCSIL